MKRDPAVVEARRLLKERDIRGAVEVYERRILELALLLEGYQGKPGKVEIITGNERKWLRAALGIILIIVLIALALYLKSLTDEWGTF